MLLSSSQGFPAVYTEEAYKEQEKKSNRKFTEGHKYKFLTFASQKKSTDGLTFLTH